MTVVPRPQALALEEPLPAIAEAANARIATLEAKADPALKERVDVAIRLLDEVMPGRGYQHLPPLLFDLAAGSDMFLPLLTARLLAQVSARRVTRRVPDALLPGLRRQAMRILELKSPSLDDDAFRKDLSICLLLSLPCGAQVVEENGGIPRGALVTGGPLQALRLSACFARTGLRSGPYLELHTHTPMLGDFNPAGWIRCYELVAELLMARPDHLGMVGGSWFLDPALASISPRLTYVPDIPIRGGAFRVRLGSSKEDAELATATSPTRRALVSEGKYVPERWLLIWPRKELLRWARRRTGNTG